MLGTKPEQNIIMLGSGGHASVLMDVLRLQNIKPTAMADPGRDRGGSDFYGLPCLGDDEAILDRDPDKIILVNGVGSTTRPRQRDALFHKFKERGYNFLTIVHPMAVVSPSVQLGEGSQIMPGCVIQAHAVIGANAIVNTRASVDHHAEIGISTHIAPGVTVCGGVRVGRTCMIGAGATLIQNIEIGDLCLVGAGTAVTQNLESHTRVVTA